MSERGSRRLTKSRDRDAKGSSAVMLRLFESGPTFPRNLKLTDPSAKEQAAVRGSTKIRRLADRVVLCGLPIRDRIGDSGGFLLLTTLSILRTSQCDPLGRRLVTSGSTCVLIA